MAEAQRSISPNTKELRVRLKRLKLDQQLNDNNGSISDDDEDGNVVLKKADSSDREVQGACAMDNSCATNTQQDCMPSEAGASAMLVDNVQTLACSSDYSDDEIVIDEIVKDLPTILSLPPFDPYAPAPQTDIVFKPVVSLMQLSLREDNVIEVEVSKKLLSEYCNRSKRNDDFDEDDLRTFTELDAEISMKLLCEYSKSVIRTAEGQLRPITDLADIFVKHDKDEFYTFCSCKDCLEYRETIMSIMMDQFKAAHMVVMLLDVLIKAYSPMLKNDSAYNKFEKLLESNKEIYWITSGYLYDKNADYLDFIDDSTISDNMILVLFSSILMVNNPMLLLQILAYNVECIVKAFSEGIIEIAQPKNGKIPAAKMLTYVLEGYSDLNCISQKISLNLFAFENDFLRRFKLTWVLLCQRLFQQHVYTHLADTMLACIITLKEDVLTQQNSSLIKRYILFDEHMNSIERRWGDIWIELNKFNTSEVEHVRRTGLLEVHCIFDTVVMDATSFSLPDISDDEFTDFQRIEDRHLAWRNIMAFTKLKWPDGFYDPPNTIVYEDRCSKCNILLEYHLERNCKCVTCSVAGGPMAPIAAVASGTCAKCATHAIVEKNPRIKKSKILSTCTSDDSSSTSKISAARKSIALEEFNEETVVIKRNEGETLRTSYHIAWAVFQHLTTRKRYRLDSIEPQNFCNESCRVSACLLARKILNNEIAPMWTQLLVRYFQPLSFSREELRATLPSIMFFNRKMHPCNVELREQQAHNYILKTYWTFILSIYANFFMKFNFPSATDFKNLEVVNRDLRLRLRNIVGDDNDMSFETFLSYAKRLSPFRSTDDLALLDAHIDQMQKGLDKLMSIHEAQIIKHPRHDAAARPRLKDASSSTMPNNGSGDNGAKKPCKEKMRKCCLEYSDIGEHCKENHTKKRVKKECNHARYNETRDRLRKKFAQIVNERKNKTTAPEPKAATSESVSAKAAADTQPVPAAAVPASTTKEPPTLKSVATAAAGLKTTSERFKTASENSLSCLDSLCKRIQLGKPLNCPKDFKEAAKVSTAQLEAARAQIRAKEKDIEKMVASLHLSNSIGVVNEFYEFLDNYTKEQNKKWINEALNFIEGKDKPQQPQTTNPKKAAKKAKQKMRKEEEKRIGELHDLRGQFHDIYFKEFAAKQELKAHVTSSKKRDKKRISELEVNIKKLQRAKAKVETGILELIATVKQTNAEFKFTYLPTKEQQQQKLRNKTEVDTSNAPNQAAINTVDTEIRHTKCKAESLTATMINNHMPNLHQFINFPKHKPFFSPMKMQTPMCYAPPQQQQLPPDVVAAMAANTVTADPAKRIVTIRRVNMPNANEPQVTVTAKGRSPDEDKLLYTFVNGQLVPSTMSAHVPLNELDAYRNLRLPSLNKTLNKKESKRAPTVANGSTSVVNLAASNVVEHKLEKLKANCPNEKLEPSQVKQSKKVKSTAKGNKSSIVQNAYEASTKESTSSTTTCSNSTSKSETPLSSSVNTRENSVCSLKPTNNNRVQTKQTKQATASAQKAQIKAQKCAPVKQSVIKPAPEVKTVSKAKAKSPERESQTQEVAKVKEKRQKRSKLVDSGQFDNNPFKTLQDSSDSEWESGSECQYNSIAEVPPPPALKSTVIDKSAKATVVVDKKEVVTVAPNAVSKKKEFKEAAPSTIVAPVIKKGKQQDAVKQQQPQVQTQKPVPSNKTQTNTKQPNAQQAQPTNATCSKRQPENAATRTRAGKQQQQKQASSTSPAAAAAAAAVATKHQQQPQQRTRNANRSQTQVSPAQTLDAENVIESSSPPTASSKRAQRSKRYQKQKQDCMSGIPNNMGYFNPNEVAIPPPAQQNPTPQQLQANYTTNICQKFQNMRINNSNAPAQTYAGKLLPSNVSIMDQLNRGVQVENLSLPPGITLTKVDPIKSEQLRQKSESIRKLSKPLQVGHQVTPPPNAVMSRMSFQQSNPQHAATIIPSGSNYYGSSYGGDTSGIIMVEANPKANGQQQQPSVAAAAAAAAASGKSSSRRRRRNKTKSSGVSSNSGKSRDNVPDVNECAGNAASGSSTKMVTLRNPMFHGNAGSGSGVTSGASVIHQQPPMLPGRSYGGVPMSATLPMDQPAAIIKNDNGMFTIRNPVLHQAVTNGLALSGYRQFGNVNYYTPQEAAAEASRSATQAQPTAHDQLSASELPTNSSCTPTSFSYFSSGMANVVSTDRANSTHNNISISCTNVNNSATANCGGANDNGAGRRLIGDAAVIARPTKPVQQKCISAIGSEIKQKTKESGHQWSNFGQDFSAAEFNNHPAVLQEKYQQSNYYNGFDVFPTVQNAGGNSASSLFDPTDCHIPHHSCGDDSPPPTITGFNSYLEGIPNTGVIRYDDASFLKNLIPGQQLNNEVSIHNISDSNYARSTASPAPHHVELTAVYGGRPQSTTNSFEHPPQTNSNPGANYCDQVTDYVNDSQLYSQTNILTGMPEIDVRDRYNYDFEPPTVSTSSSTSATADSQQQGIIDLNELLRRSPHSQRTSPYNIDENTALETFVQNMNALQIAAAAAGTTASDADQCSHLNGSGINTEANSSSSAKGAEGTTASASNGWW